ncbi:hypothetical protein GCM10017784_34820 [Deinococcus indicus]|uniref:major capsid protein n=1 Tax=Deinococcus indicus TaxID=223556 RepID=UPI00174CFA64|nr:major capsid protein [Deinococcus indicus]GHG37484.1 hypothetical protein GCM10017784_34820 [Deinococcus indicus]
MADFSTLIARARQSGELAAVAGAQSVRFGTPTRRRKFLEMLPPRLVDENMYYEEDLAFKDVIAAPNARYAPPVLVKGEHTASVRVELGDSSVSRELKAQEYDAIIKFLRRGEDMEGLARYLQFNRSIRAGLDDLLELQAVQAVINGTVIIKGANGVLTEYAYPNPAGHRVAIAPGDNLTDPDTDPYELLASLHATGVNGGSGNAVRALTSTDVIRTILAHPRTGERFGRYAMNNGTLTGLRSNVQLADYNGYLQADGLPALEAYDGRYRTQTNSYRFMPNDALVFQFDTGRDPEIDLGDEGIIQLPNAPVGYTAIGTVAGETDPGQIIRERNFPNDTPPRVEIDGVQTSLTVIQNPGAIVSVTGLIPRATSQTQTWS